MIIIYGVFLIKYMEYNKGERKMKKICIKGNEFNTNYHEVYGEEQAIANRYSVFEVPEGYEDCAREDFDDNGFNVELYNARKLKEEKQIKVNEAYQYLRDTDYICNKLTEALVVNDANAINLMKIKYADELVKRQEMREFIDKYK